MAIKKAIITYDDGTEATFEGKPAVPAVAEIPAEALDLSTIPLESEAEIAAKASA